MYLQMVCTSHNTNLKITIIQSELTVMAACAAETEQLCLVYTQTFLSFYDFKIQRHTKSSF